MSQSLQFVCTVTAEAHVTDSKIIFGNWVEDGETDTLFELHGGYLHVSLCCWKSSSLLVTARLRYIAGKTHDEWGIEEFQLLYKEGFLITNQYLDNHAATGDHCFCCKCHRLNVISPYAKANWGSPKRLGARTQGRWARGSPCLGAEDLLRLSTRKAGGFTGYKTLDLISKVTTISFQNPSLQT